MMFVWSICTVPFLIKYPTLFNALSSVTLPLIFRTDPRSSTFEEIFILSRMKIPTCIAIRTKRNSQFCTYSAVTYRHQSPGLIDVLANKWTLIFLSIITHINDTILGSAIPVDQRIASSLYLLGSSCELRTSAHLFGVGTFTVTSMLHEFCTIPIDLSFPWSSRFPSTTEEIQQTIDDFL